MLGGGHRPNFCDADEHIYAWAELSVPSGSVADDKPEAAIA